MAKIEGVGPNVEHIKEDGGGTRSKAYYASDQLPPRALLRIARRFQFGMESGHERDNWKKLPLHSFIQHGLTHLLCYMAGDTSEGEPIIHLEAATWNFLAAIEVYYLRKENPPIEVQISVDTSQFQKQMETVSKALEQNVSSDKPAYDWETNAYAMSILRHTIQRNKVQGHDDENVHLEYTLRQLEWIECNATAEKQHKV